MKSIKKVHTSYIEYENEKGQYHREDGPAIEYEDGYKAWYINGQRHREDGPAIIWEDGKEWFYLYGEEYSEDKWKEEVINLKLKRILDL